LPEVGALRRSSTKKYKGTGNEESRLVTRNKLGISDGTSRRLKEIEQDAKRRKILEVAFEMFSRKGYVETTVSEIAEGVGLGKGTIYDYFNSKLEILIETYKEHSVLMEIGNLDELGDIRSEREVLEYIALKTFEHARENLKIRRLWMIEALKRVPDSSEYFYRNMAQPVIEALEKYIKEKQREGRFKEGDSFILALTFWGIWFAFRFWYDLMGGKAVMPRPTEKIISEVVKMYLEGVMKKGEG
jgi:TetR/AcrR family fatty acid metabolism transcriptional regulator